MESSIVTFLSASRCFHVQRALAPHVHFCNFSQSKAASAFSASFPMKSLESDHAPKGSSSRLTRGPSTDRLRALSVVETDDWSKGVTFADWYSLIQRSFERYFWIPEDGAQDGSYDIGSSRPWVRGIYKDCIGCQDDWFMFQLRPNQAIAMAVAPFLFDPDHARVGPNISSEAYFTIWSL